MALNAGASLAIQIPSGHFRFSLAAPALMAVLAGMAIGGRASRHMSDRGLERILGAILLAVAVWIAWSRILESLPVSRAVFRLPIWLSVMDSRPRDLETSVSEVELRASAMTPRTADRTLPV
jgi:hypothetical protein